MGEPAEQLNSERNPRGRRSYAPHRPGNVVLLFLGFLHAHFSLLTLHLIGGPGIIGFRTAYHPILKVCIVGRILNKMPPLL